MLLKHKEKKMKERSLSNFDITVVGFEENLNLCNHDGVRVCVCLMHCVKTWCVKNRNLD